ncbi:integrase family protein [Herbaspirillum sp. RV1423]|uniref:tyrosine-type recombinase/integrase n=1 Tax=Herbaspirillum sp. RV1423 TaxID=1443993 RepID=UPI0018CC041A|nr:integrase family protein [Herbaspirillum sp. RV1423]
MTYEYPKTAKLTQSEIEGFPLSTDGKQVTVYDTALRGFALRIGATAKTFIVYKRVANGAPIRVTLGKYGHITPAQARTMAQQKLAELTSGINPIAVKQAKKAEEEKPKINATQTLEWLLDEYTKDVLVDDKGGRVGTLKDIKICKEYCKARTITVLEPKGDEWKVKGQVKLSDWLSRPFREITRQEILDRFQLYSVAKPARIIKKNGLQPITRTHQLVFKYLNSAYNYIIPVHELDLKENFRNPFDVIKNRKMWKKTNERTNFIDFRKDEFQAWWNALIEYREHNEVVSDYILFSLIQTGRSIDIAPLRWEYIDFELEEVNYKQTKNGSNYRFPITKLGIEILKRRKEHAINEYVFGYEDSKNKHVTQDCKFHFQNLYEASGKLVSHHDLRRTWGTAATWLRIDILHINYLLKHKMTDSNAPYLMANYDQIKEALQEVEDLFLNRSTILAKQNDSE